MNLTSIRQKITGWMNPVGRFLIKLKLTPNIITFLSFLTALGAAVSFFFCQFILGAFLLLLSGGLDLADGTVARIINKKSKFGAAIDWITDKYSDGLVLLGIGLSIFNQTPWYLSSLQIPSVVYIAVAGIAIIGSIMNTFIKPVAYAEIGFSGKDDGKIADPLEGVGFFGRPETIILLIIGGFSGFIWIAVAIIAICTNISAIQRIVFLYRKYGKVYE